MLTTEYCTECHNLGFVIMGNNDRNKVERCDTCRRFDDDEEATKALDQFIAKHAPPAPAEEIQPPNHHSSKALTNVIRELDQAVQDHPCAVALNHLLAQAELTDAGQWNDAKSFKKYVVTVAVAALAEAGLKVIQHLNTGVNKE